MFADASLVACEILKKKTQMFRIRSDENEWEKEISRTGTTGVAEEHGEVG